MKSNIKYILFAIIIFINLLTIFSFKFDFNDLDKYLDEEKLSLDSIENYLSSEENRIFRLRQMYERFRQQNKITLQDKNLFLSHPNDVYLLIKRITIEWKNVKEFLKTSENFIKQFIKIQIFQDAAFYYGELIGYYKLSVKSAANGLIEYKTSSGDKKVFKSLSNQSFDTFDCFSIGMQSFHMKRYFWATKWYEEALQRTGNGSTSQLKAKIFEYLVLSEFNQGKIDNAKQYLNQSHNINPNRPMLKLMLDNFDKFSKQQRITQNMQDVQSKVFVNVHASNTSNLELYEASDDLCLGKKLMNISYESKLKCFYLNTTLRPYLRLTRVRVEELYKRPQIVLIHNFLSETEVQELKNYSKPNLQMGTVLGELNKQVYDSDKRVAFDTSLSPHLKLFNQINRRFSEISGLNTLNSNNEDLNVIRYSVGGRFDIHHDSGSDPDASDSGRFLIWLTYLNDVEASGATVFPKYKVSVFPEKYSSLFWFNHKSSGDVDQDMYHTGCPVLYGQKWITAKGLMNRGQTHDKCPANINEFRFLQEVD